MKQDEFLWWQSLDDNWKKEFQLRLNHENLPTLEELQNLVNSKTLYLLICNDIENLEPIENFIYLEELSLSLCSNLKCIKSLSKCINLKKLKLSGTKVNDISLIQNFSELEELSLTDYINEIKSVSKLLKLKRLFFRTSYAIETLEELKNLSELEELAISDNICDLSPIDHLKKLKRIVCYGVKKKEVDRFKLIHPNIEIIYSIEDKKRGEKILKRLGNLKS